MLHQNSLLLQVSALIVTRKSSEGYLEVLNVLANNKTKYGFPGGKLEEAESPQDAVMRETEEELGVIPTHIVYQDLYKGFTPEGQRIKMFVFTGNVTDNITPTNEIVELHWLTYDQMVSNLELLTPMTIKYILPLIKLL